MARVKRELNSNSTKRTRRQVALPRAGPQESASDAGAPGVQSTVVTGSRTNPVTSGQTQPRASDLIHPIIPGPTCTTTCTQDSPVTSGQLDAISLEHSLPCTLPNNPSIADNNSPVKATAQTPPGHFRTRGLGNFFVRKWTKRTYLEQN